MEKFTEPQSMTRFQFTDHTSKKPYKLQFRTCPRMEWGKEEVTPGSTQRFDPCVLGCAFPGMDT